MSQDVSIFRTCDHHVTEENYFLNSDWRTISIYRYIANQKSLEIKRNGFIITPNGTKTIRLPDDTEAEIPSDFQFTTQDDKEIPGKKILIFNKVQKTNNDFYEISYYTTVEWCPKCNGLSFYFDWVFDDLGRLFLIQNEEKLVQDIVKGTLTIKGSNTYHTWYGTILNGLIGGKIANFENLKVVMGNDVDQFIKNLKSLQFQQKQFQTVTKEESVDQLVSLNVAQREDDPTFVEISIIIRNEAGNIKEIRRVIDKNNRIRVTGQIRDKLSLA